MLQIYEAACEDMMKVAAVCISNPCKESYTNYKVSLEHLSELHKTLSASITKELELRLARARSHCEYF